jgi:hypothetical protein
MKLVRLCLVGLVLLGGSGCVWDHGHDRGDNRGAGYSDRQRGERGDVRTDRDRYDEQRLQENHDRR